MYVRIINLGTNWWTMHGGDVNDPFCFRRKAAYFNAAALLCGRHLHHSTIFPGQIRFNATSGFDPEFTQRALGKTFLCKGPSQVGGKCHLLFVRSARGVRPDACLITLKSSDHGAIAFNRAGWKSGNVQPISISQRASRYEAMLLLGIGDWVRSDLGKWRLNPCGNRLVLSVTNEEVSR